MTQMNSAWKIVSVFEILTHIYQLKLISVHWYNYKDIALKDKVKKPIKGNINNDAYLFWKSKVTYKKSYSIAIVFIQHLDSYF